MTTLSHDIRALPRDGQAIRKLQVLFLHRDLPYHGGVPKCLLYLTENTPRDRMGMHVACFQDPSQEMVRAFGSQGVEPVCLGDNGYIAPALKLRRLLRERQIDVIVGSSFKSYLCAKMACIGMGQSNIFWLHAAQGVVRGAIKKTVFRMTTRRDTLIYVSDAVRKHHEHDMHQGTSAVIYNGVCDPMDDPDHVPYPRSKRAELGLPADAMVMGYTGAFVPCKDHATLLKAFAAFDHKSHDAHLVLIGEGPLQFQMQLVAQQLGIASRVHFLGSRPDARRLLGLMDVYVHPCQGEGFGLAVVEAMLAGVPVLAARDGALVEYIQEKQNGTLFNSGDDNDLAVKMRLICDDLANAQRMALRARLLCLAKFSPRRFAESVCRVVEKAAGL